ncbi:MAG: N-acetyl-gamma-glutamyl-phosphate reductase [Elusimicrobia bacterium]|nr:N-acetyl-gamma-glutamyl-phosphate reductase [Candidatus Obscuribacterium magneticum]
MIRVSILGASGYSGGELIRLLTNRPNIKLQHLTSESSGGEDIAALHPSLRGRVRRRFENLDVKKISRDSDVVFSCYPAAVGVKPIVQFLKAGLKVIDLSADFRLPTAHLYKTWYKVTHPAPGFIAKAVYGLPEYFRAEIRQASLIANPGCYATATLLAVLPLLKHRLIETDSVIVDAKSGVSGAGKKVTSQYMYCEANENLQAYAVAVHRHQPEIEQVIKKVTRLSARVTFVPHLVPMNRGILSVIYATLKKSMNKRDLRAVFLEAATGEPFVRLLPEGELPQTKNVLNTNYCDIGIAQDVRMKRVIVLSAIDNLVKGAAGQALQNMNLCLRRPETEGLL